MTGAGLPVRLPITTDRLVLRPHTMDDLDDLVVFHSDPEVVRYVPWPVRDRVATEETLRVKLTQTELVAPGQWLVLAVELAGDRHRDRRGAAQVGLGPAG